MKAHFLPAFIMALLAADAYGADADSLSLREAHRNAIADNVKAVAVGGGQVQEDSARQLIEIFYEDQYRQFHDPEAPHFMFMSKDANLALGIGGKVMLRGWFDWNGSQDSYEFFPYGISVPKNPSQRHGLGASMSQTSVMMTLLGRSKSVHYMIFVQAGVKNSSFVLKKAYLKLNDFTVGLTNSTFEDPDALAPTVDAQGSNGQVSKTQIVGRWFRTLRNGISAGAGIGFPSADMSPVEGESEACRQYIPDLAALVQYSWDGGVSHVRLSGLLCTMTYRNLLQKKNHNVVGWGAQLSGTLNIIRPLTLYFSVMGGRGCGSYQGDLSEGAYDLVAAERGTGRMIAPWSVAATAGVQYNFTDRIFACVSLGENRYFVKSPLDPAEYKYGLYGAVNLFWNITPRFLAGVEYIAGKRMNHDRRHAGANRIDAMVSYSF